MTKKQKTMLTRIIITAAILVALKFIPLTGIPQLIAYLAAYLVIGYDILGKAWKGILNRQIFDEMTSSVIYRPARFVEVASAMRESKVGVEMRGDA